MTRLFRFCSEQTCTGVTLARYSDPNSFRVQLAAESDHTRAVIEAAQ